MTASPANSPSPPPPVASSSSTSSSSLPSAVSSRALLDWLIAHTSPAARSLLAGGCAGCVAKTATAPLDRVKILYQGSNPLLHRFTTSWSGPFQAVLWIWREEGWRGCYKGHAATLLRIFPYAALNYFCYERYKRAIVQWTRLHRIEGVAQQAAVSVLAGGLAGSTSVAFTYPLDYVHSRITYQVRISRYRGIVQTIRSTLQEGVEQAKAERLMRSMGDTEAAAAAGSSEQTAVKGVKLPLPHLLYGIRKLYTGFGTTIMGIIPYAGVSFATYDTLKRLTTQLSAQQRDAAAAASVSTRLSLTTCLLCPAVSYPDSQPPVIIRLLWGACAGAAAQTASYPLDVVRRRMQLFGLSSRLPHYRHTLHALLSIVRSEGWRGLYVGLSINYIKVAPAHAISFFTYDALKRAMRVDEHRPRAAAAAG